MALWAHISAQISITTGQTFSVKRRSNAMTELFGGFSPRFYAVYNEALPLGAGYKTRKFFYNLYHVPNHLNLFGGSYQSQAQRMIELLLSEIK